MGEAYRDGAQAFATLAQAMSEDDWSKQIAATPAWTAKDVFSHIAGGGSDLIAGRVDGAPGRAWTQRHVDERRAIPVDQLVAEIMANAEAIAELADSGSGPNPAWDIRVHEYDLRETLGLTSGQSDSWRAVAHAAIRLFNKTASNGAAILVEEDVEGDTATLSRSSTVLLTVDLYELFRGMFSRRSEAQIRAWDWRDIDAQGQTELIPTFFGPRTDDQPRLL